MTLDQPGNQPETQPSRPRRRRAVRAGLLAAVAVGGATAVTVALVSPLGGKTPAQASPLPTFADCEAFTRHMQGLALDRLAGVDRANPDKHFGDDRDDWDEEDIRRDRENDDRDFFDRLSGAFDLSGDDDQQQSVAQQPMAPAAAAPAPAADAAAAPAAEAESAPARDSVAAADAPAATGRDSGASAKADKGASAGYSGNSESLTETKSARAGSEPLTGGLSAPDGAVGSGPTGTNVQEAGVDEADLAKTDGRLLVTVIDEGADEELKVMDVSGEEPRARGSVELPGQQPLELLMDGDQVLVVGSGESSDRTAGRFPQGSDGRFFDEGIEATTLTLVDLADPDEPVIRASEEFSARYVSARMSDDVIRIVLSSSPDLDMLGLGPRSYRGDWDRPSLRELRDRIQRTDAEDWLPTRRVVDREARTVDEAPLVDCADIRHPATDSGLDLLSVLSIDAGADDGLASALSTAVVGTGDLVYASPDRLYLATTEGGWGRGWTGRGDDWREEGSTVTRVHAFDITGEAAEYLASGQVDGYLYGRWAMSERSGLLRVVTTETAPWSGRGGTDTGVSVLEVDGDRMRVIGHADGLGLTETVRSVRWFDDLAAIVTFRQTDPLYLVDLSNPRNPRVRGELKIPGYSAYLHPVGDHRLLGVGQDATGSGRELGLQLSSFDILDVEAPIRTDSLFLGDGTSSPAEQDPRGFVYLPEEQLAILPVRVPGYACRTDAQCARSEIPAGLAFPENERGGSNTGLASVRVEDDGDLDGVAAWSGTRGRDVVKVMPLPDGRLVALNRGGITLLEADTLTEYGFASYR